MCMFQTTSLYYGYDIPIHKHPGVSQHCYPDKPYTHQPSANFVAPPSLSLFAPWHTYVEISSLHRCVEKWLTEAQVGLVLERMNHQCEHL
jgi:hypothetical protein